MAYNNPSLNYRSNGTLGQSAETGERTSTNYQLVSGFWARVSGVGEPQPTPTPTPEVSPTATPTATPVVTPTVTPTPTPTPTIPPEFYGVSINDAALYTHDFRVTLSLDAPYAVEMMVSNDGGFPDAYWEAYAITNTWEIDFYQNYVLPRTVYVRFRDADGFIYGNFTDDIIYDPNEPSGTLSVTDVGTGTVSLYIDLQDDLSGASEIMISVGPDWETAQWEPCTAWKTVAAQPGDTIYIRYRDVAGNESLYPLEIQVPGGSQEIYLPVIVKGYGGAR